MKNMPLKLGIFIVVLFGVVILGMVLYEPLWWKWQEWRLQSDDKSTRDAAAEAIVERGDKAIPYIRSWLKTKNDNLVSGACQALVEMKDNAWESALPELITILNGIPSNRTNAAADVLMLKDYVFACYERLAWKRFYDKPSIRRNICICFLNAESDKFWRNDIIPLLGEIDDIYSIKTLTDIAQNDSEQETRILAIIAMGDKKNPQVLLPLIEMLERDSNSDIRYCSALMLGRQDSDLAAEALLNALKKDNHSFVRRIAAIALAEFENDKIQNELIAALEEGNRGALISLAWQLGGKYLDKVAKTEIIAGDEDYILKYFRDDVLARWGNTSAIYEVLGELGGYLEHLQPFHEDIFARMPKGFPRFNFRDTSTSQTHQRIAMMVWFNKYKSRLAWNEKTRKYYLLPETDAGAKDK